MTTRRQWQRKREPDPKSIGLGTSIGTLDLRVNLKDIKTHPEKITRKTEEEREIKNMIKGGHKKDTIQRNMQTRRGTSSRDASTEMSTRIQGQEKT